MESNSAPETFVESEIGLREYLYILVQRRWWFAATFLVIVALVTVYSFMATPIYKSTAKLLVATGQVRGAGPTGDVLSDIMDITQARTLETQREIIKSAEVMKPALRKAHALAIIKTPETSIKTLAEFMEFSADALSVFALDPGDRTLKELEEYPDEELAELAEAAEASAEESGGSKNGAATKNSKRSRVKTEGLKRTDIITVACESPDAEFAMIVANAVADTYVDLTLERNREAARKGRVFVEKQLEGASEDLDQAGRDLRDFREESGIAGVDQAGASLVARLQGQTETASELRAAVAARRLELNTVRRKLREDRPLVKSAEQIVQNPVINRLNAQLSQLETERASLSGEFAPTSQKITAIDDEIQEVKAQMAREAVSVVSSESLVDPVDPELVRRLVMAEVELLGDVERSAAADRVLSETRAQIERLPDAQRSTAELQRTLMLAETRFITLRTEREKLRLAEESTIASATIIEDAETPRGRIKPNRRMNLLLGTILGIALAFAVVMLVNYLDDTFATVEEIERELGVSVLTVVYRLPSDESPLLKSPLGRGPFAEAFRMLRSGLRFSAVKRPIKTLVVTSPGVGEGKSTVSLNLAIACAEGGQRTIIVDADLRRPTLHRVLNLEKSVGLTNCILNEMDISEAVQKTDYANLSFMATGPRPPTPGELLDSEPMRELVERLKDVADLIIFDTPPAMIIADAQVLARVCDGVLPVMELETTKRPAMRRLVEVLNRAETAIPGIVVNKARRQPGAYYYYYSYGYYSEYYDEYEDKEEGGSSDGASA